MKTVTRFEAIEIVRASLKEFVDDDHCMCEVAARYGIYCGGFTQWSFDELKQRYAWLVRRHPSISRRELERLANIWQLARQEVLGRELACDAQALEHDTCQGWDGWSNDDIARYIHEFRGVDLDVVDADAS